MPISHLDTIKRPLLWRENASKGEEREQVDHAPFILKQDFCAKYASGGDL